MNRLGWKPTAAGVRPRSHVAPAGDDGSRKSKLIPLGSPSSAAMSPLKRRPYTTPVTRREHEDGHVSSEVDAPPAGAEMAWTEGSRTSSLVPLNGSSSGHHGYISSDSEAESIPTDTTNSSAGSRQGKYSARRRRASDAPSASSASDAPSHSSRSIKSNDSKNDRDSSASSNCNTPVPSRSSAIESPSPAAPSRSALRGGATSRGRGLASRGAAAAVRVQLPPDTSSAPTRVVPPRAPASNPKKVLVQGNREMPRTSFAQRPAPGERGGDRAPPSGPGRGRAGRPPPSIGEDAAASGATSGAGRVNRAASRNAPATTTPETSTVTTTAPDVATASATVPPVATKTKPPDAPPAGTENPPSPPTPRTSSSDSRSASSSSSWSSCSSNYSEEENAPADPAAGEDAGSRRGSVVKPQSRSGTRSGSRRSRPISGEKPRSRRGLSLKSVIRGTHEKRVAIGRGSFGTVYTALDSATGDVVAYKEIPLASYEADLRRQCQGIRREISTMRALDHENIVRYLGVDKDSEHNCLLIYMEYVPNGSVAGLIRRYGPLSEAVAAIYAKQVLQGLSYLHSRDPPLIHRDIKGDNVLVSSRGIVKLADFGTSRRLMEVADHATTAGTPWFMAPESIKDSTYGVPSDIWSFGCLLIEMVSGKPPFADLGQFAAMFKIANESPLTEVPADISPQLRDLLEKCLEPDPSKRPSAVSLLSHQWIIRAGATTASQENLPTDADRPVTALGDLSRSPAESDEENGTPGPAAEAAAARSPPTRAKALVDDSPIPTVDILPPPLSFSGAADDDDIVAHDG